MALSTYRSFVAAVVRLRTLRGKLGQRLKGALAFLQDELAEGLRHATRASWIGDTSIGPAYDALGPGGSELSLPRYPVETWTQYHERLKRVWQDWPFAGDESTIIGQLTEAGFPGAVIYTPLNADFDPSDYWSHFIVFLPEGSHPVVAPAPKWGAFNWGDGTKYGPIGLTSAQYGTIRSIIRKFKPGHWICRWVVFQISGWQYGTGHTWGEAGLKWGGQSARVGA
jgi:hypothetical protein